MLKGMTVIAGAALMALATGPAFSQGQGPGGNIGNTLLELGDDVNELKSILKPKLIFVTNDTTFTGNLGGLSGADDKCQAAADAVPLGGEFMAWLSVTDPDDTPTTRFTTLSLGPYFQLDGRVVDANFALLLQGNLAASIEVNENGVVVAGQAWTGTNGTGKAAVNNCTDWTVTAGTGRTGALGDQTVGWTQGPGDLGCNEEKRLYCFEQ